ncbi:unnamed protein product [Caenorhabditis auriculariae]|uniref:Uncharacterized protein n=1 Tax=Caenorhabditis auriculariae TaxID=2777116 RepID=A0A8S1GSH6_9PELO|nr:unnamed protein product [Caenorhabditis auriculariae]
MSRTTSPAPRDEPMEQEEPLLAVLEEVESLTEDLTLSGDTENAEKARKAHQRLIKTVEQKEEERKQMLKERRAMEENFVRDKNSMEVLIASREEQIRKLKEQKATRNSGGGTQAGASRLYKDGYAYSRSREGAHTTPNSTTKEKRFPESE